MKFRAWDWILKKWIFKDIGLWELFSEIQDNILFYEISWENLKERLIFMQYTGLKDIKGKEIYEGDILSNEDDYLKFIVEFDLGRFVAIDNKRHDIYDLKMIASQCEVIGNIYENPELIKEV